MKIALFSGIGIFLLLAAWVPAYGQPAPEMYTLDQIYYYLVEGTESSWGEYSLEPQSGVPGGAIPGYSKNLGDIYDDAEAKFRQCDAVPGQVRDTAVFFSTDTDNWGPKTGTIATRTLSAANQNVAEGFYAATTLSAVDADLAAGNIKSGVNIFGVAGDPNVVNTSSGDAIAGDLKSGKKAWVDGAEVTGTIATRTLSAANQIVAEGFYAATTLSAVDADLATANIKSGVTVFGINGSYSGSGGGLLKTGQTTSYYAGDDGAYRKGTAFSYTNNGNGTVTDNVTGLMWASDGSAAGCYSGGTRTWTQALDWAEGLTFAGYSDWRLPNRRELESIVDSSTYNPAINTTYFPNTVSGYYWSGSTDASGTTLAWYVNFNYGSVVYYDKTFAVYVRAVRDAE